MDSIIQDIRYGLRMLVKNPGIAVISILAFTLGIGLTTTMFSIVYGAIYRGLPFEEPRELMHLERNNLPEDIESMEVTIHDFIDWREQQTTFEDLTAFYNRSSYLAGSEGRPERYTGAFLSANFLGQLGVQPLIGRGFREGEDSPAAEPVMLISYGVWRDRYAADPDIVGVTARLNGETMTIVGVMPEGFEFPLDNQLWTPLRMNHLEIERGEGITLEVYGRLKDGYTQDMAQAEFSAIASRLALEYPESNEGIGAIIKPYTDEFIGEQPRQLLQFMLLAVFLVLLVACANVANLLLSRAAVRTKEVAIRSAMGASRSRVVMQLLAEAFAIAAVGGVIGIGLGWLGVKAFNWAIVDANPPFWIDIKIDPVAVIFVLGLVLVSSLVAGIVPALQASGANVNEVLKDESRGSSSLHIGKVSKGLVVLELALSFGLLVSAGLMVKSVVNAANVEYGFNTESVFTARLGLPVAAYPDSLSQTQFYDELQPRLEARFGSGNVTLARTFPALGSQGRRFALEGETYERDQDYPETNWVRITPGYFETFGVSIRQGRDFTQQDNPTSLPVAIVNESFAASLFPDESPLGRRIRLGDSDTEEPWLTIVGVAPDMYLDGPNVDDEDYDPEGVYTPFHQNPDEWVGVAINVAGGDPLAITPEVRDIVASVDDNMPIYFVDSLGGWLDQSTWFVRVFGTIFMIFGGVALFLASVGLYGVMAFSVRQRTKEMGIRMALGAEGRDVMRLIVRQGLVQLAIGLVLGLGLAALLSRGMDIILFGVEPLDPMTFISIAIVLIGTGLLASFVPARRATRVDPVIALRYE
ncbi:MAG: ABC transporter permease [Gemmatimonadota bacterium]